MLAVDVDSSERPTFLLSAIEIDYLTFGGIYREVSLRIVPATFIENVFAKPKDVLTDHPSLDVDCYIQHIGGIARCADSRSRVCAMAIVCWRRARSAFLPAQAAAEPVAHTVHLDNLGSIKLWDLTHPNLYTRAGSPAARDAGGG